MTAGARQTVGRAREALRRPLGPRTRPEATEDAPRGRSLAAAGRVPQRLVAAVRRRPREAVLGAAAALVVLALGYMGLLSGVRSDAAQAREGAATAHERVASLQDTLARQAAEQQARQDRAAELEAAARALPEGPRLSPEALVELERLAGEAGVRVVSVQQAPGQPAGPVGTDALTISVAGGFPAAQAFVARLHDMVRMDPEGRVDAAGPLLAVTRVEMAAGGGDAQADAAGAAGEVTTTLQVMAFTWAPGASSPAAAGSPAAPPAPAPAPGMTP